jgi:hypothetical protein
MISAKNQSTADYFRGLDDWEGTIENILNYKPLDGSLKFPSQDAAGRLVDLNNILSIDARLKHKYHTTLMDVYKKLTKDDGMTYGALLWVFSAVKPEDASYLEEQLINEELLDVEMAPGKSMHTTVLAAVNDMPNINQKRVEDYLYKATDHITEP